MKQFTIKDTSGNHISADRADLLYAPTAWQRAGLMETRTGYGKRLNTGYKIGFEGRLYRLYCTQYSNAGSVWFKTGGRTVYIRS